MANSTPPHSHILMDEFSLGEEACSEEPLVDAEYSDEEYWSEYESTDEDEYEPLNNCELEALALITDWVENNVDSFSNKEAKLRLGPALDNRMEWDTLVDRGVIHGDNRQSNSLVNEASKQLATLSLRPSRAQMESSHILQTNSSVSPKIAASILSIAFQNVRLSVASQLKARPGKESLPTTIIDANSHRVSPTYLEARRQLHAKRTTKHLALRLKSRDYKALKDKNIIKGTNQNVSNMKRSLDRHTTATVVATNLMHRQPPGALVKKNVLRKEDLLFNPPSPEIQPIPAPPPQNRPSPPPPFPTATRPRPPLDRRQPSRILRRNNIESQPPILGFLSSLEEKLSHRSTLENLLSRNILKDKRMAHILQPLALQLVAHQKKDKAKRQVEGVYPLSSSNRSSTSSLPS